MKRAILTAITVAVALAAAPAHAAQAPAVAGTSAHPEGAPVTMLLAGGAEADTIEIGLSADGRSYLIDSAVPLEVGGTVCVHPEAHSNELVCEATQIGGFEVNAGGGDDAIVVAATVPIAVTLRGGPGNDRLVAGASNDKVIGGIGDDVLSGRTGSDSLFGGPGNDHLSGGPGHDTLVGNGGEDLLQPGFGDDNVIQ